MWEKNTLMIIGYVLSRASPYEAGNPVHYLIIYVNSFDLYRSLLIVPSIKMFTSIQIYAA